MKETKAITSNILILSSDTLFHKTIVANKGNIEAIIKAVPKMDETTNGLLAIIWLISFGLNSTNEAIFELKPNHSSVL